MFMISAISELNANTAKHLASRRNPTPVSALYKAYPSDTLSTRLTRRTRLWHIVV